MVGEVINIGSDNGITIKGIVTIVGKILGKDLNIIKNRKRKRPPNKDTFVNKMSKVLDVYERLKSGVGL